MPKPPEVLLPDINMTFSPDSNPYSWKASSGMMILPSERTFDHPKTYFPPLTSWGIGLPYISC